MASLSQFSRFRRFGAFEVDLEAREVRKSGLKIKLHEQFFQVLTTLLDRPGQVITRQELRDKIWPGNTFVDFDHGLNTAVNKLREALGDSADHPHFIETVPRRGYRFVAPVEAIHNGAETSLAAAAERVARVPVELASPSTEARSATLEEQRGRRRIFGTAALFLFVVVAAIAWLLLRRTNPEPALVAVPLTTYVGWEIHPSFSPDGNQVAFAWNGAKGDNFDIYIKLIGTETLIRLTSDPAADFSPSWSPDGRYIAFLRAISDKKLGVFLVSSIGGPERKLTETNGAEAGSGWAGTPGLSWSPDSKWIAMKDRNPNDSEDGIYLFSMDTGEKRKLTHPPPGSADGSPAFSMDGRSLAFTRTMTLAVSELFLIHLSKRLTPQDEPRQLTSERKWITSAAWTPSGRELIFSLGSQNIQELWRVSVSGSRTPRRLAFAGEQGGFPAISRSGNRLAYSRHTLQRDIWRVDLSSPRDKTEGRVNLISSTHDQFSPQYSPNSKKIAFISERTGRPEVWICRSDGSDAVQLTFFGATMTGSPRWSPDGEQIVFDSNVEGHFDVYIIDAAGGHPKRLTAHSGDHGVASWSTDGRSIYFVSNRTHSWQIWKMPSVGGVAVQLTRNGGYVAFESADGAFVYYTTHLWEGSLWRIPAAGGKETKILDHVIGLEFSVLDKGIYFMWPQSDSLAALQSFDFATGKTRVIARLPRSPADRGSGLSVSRDGRYALYLRSDWRISELMLVEDFR